MKILTYNVCVKQTARDSKITKEHMAEEVHRDVRAGIIAQFPNVAIRTRVTPVFTQYTAEVVVVDRIDFNKMVEEHARRLIKERLEFL